MNPKTKMIRALLAMLLIVCAGQTSTAQVLCYDGKSPVSYCVGT